MTLISDCKLISLPKISERKGALTPIYGKEQIPFDIARIYYLYDIPSGSKRGGHAHKELQQLIVAIMGSFDVTIYDGNKRKKIHFDRAHQGLYLPKQIWRELSNFSSGSICLVLASLPFDESDYIRDFDEFLILKSKTN